jgi:condensin complex subunit 1
VPSGDDTCLAWTDFRKIMSFLLGFIQKERQAEGMVEKLCLRFDCSDAPQHHRDVAFCIAALAHNDRSLRKLREMAKTYVNKLCDSEVRVWRGGGMHMPI